MADGPEPSLTGTPLTRPSHGPQLLAYSIPSAVRNWMSSPVSPGSQPMAGTIDRPMHSSPRSPAPSAPLDTQNEKQGANRPLRFRALALFHPTWPYTARGPQLICTAVRRLSDQAYRLIMRWCGSRLGDVAPASRSARAREEHEYEETRRKHGQEGESTDVVRHGHTFLQPG
jgi:hypothetical protein